ncbi:MAG: hypothetical protein J6V24_09980, partial [Clostridia bacterium]|nr:hypothetical protein [Clostridia bacterium]
MKTLSFFVVLTLLSVLLLVSNQFFLGSIVPTVLYTLAACGLTAFCAAGEKKKRVRLIGRLNALFDGGEADMTAENEESSLVRKVILTRKAAEVREKRLDEGFRNLSSLVSDIAHQSKTPLASIRMYAEMLDDSGETAV